MTNQDDKWPLPKTTFTVGDWLAHTGEGSCEVLNGYPSGTMQLAAEIGVELGSDLSCHADVSAEVDDALRQLTQCGAYKPCMHGVRGSSGKLQAACRKCRLLGKCEWSIGDEEESND